jgi:hypothetical protein
MFSLLRVKTKRIDLQEKGEPREGSRSGQETDLPLDLHRTASRARRKRWWQEWRRQRDTLERKRQAKEGRKKRRRAKKEEDEEEEEGEGERGS